MGFWQSHKGQTGYRLMNLIEQYCGFNIAEDMMIGYNQLEYHGKPLATYKWIEGNDTPFFTFYGENKLQFQREQFIKAPFIDFPYLQIPWICQEVRRKLSFDDGLHILHIAKNYEEIGGWETTTVIALKNKIMRAISESFHINEFEKLPNEYRNYIINEGWKWIGFGAIAEVIPESILLTGIKPYCIHSEFEK